MLVASVITVTEGSRVFFFNGFYNNLQGGDGAREKIFYDTTRLHDG